MKIYLFLIIGIFFIDIDNARYQSLYDDDRDKINDPLHVRHKRKENLTASPVGRNCKLKQIKLNLPDCTSDEDGKPMPFKNREPFKMVASTTKTAECKVPLLYYQWFLLDENKYASVQPSHWSPDRTLTIGPYLSYFPKINVVVKAALEEKSKKVTNEATCLIQLQVEPPKAKINGGTTKTVLSGSSFEVDGSGSKNYNSKDQSAGLNYEWKCKITQGAENDFCKKTFREPIVTVPKEYATPNTAYEFSLSVTLKPIQNVTDNAIMTTPSTDTQTVFVKKKVNRLEIKCIKNCDPEINTVTNLPVILEAVCDGPCEGVTDNSFEWEISIQDFDYDQNTKHGNKNRIFYLNPDVLSIEKEYTIDVSLTGDEQSGSAEIDLQTNGPPKLHGCEARPSFGKASDTRFQVFCIIESGFPIVRASIYRHTEDEDVDECKKQWKNARDRFLREKRAMPTGSQAPESTWPYFSKMLFYLKYTKPRKTSTTTKTFERPSSASSASSSAWNSISSILSPREPDDSVVESANESEHTENDEDTRSGQKPITEKDILLTHGKHLGRCNFVLAQPKEEPNNVKVKVTATDENQLSGVAYVEIKVYSNNLTSMTETEARDYFEKKYFSGEHSPSIDELVNAAYELNSFTNLKDKDGKTFDEKLLRELDKLNIKDGEQAKQVADVTLRVIKKFSNEPVPTITRLAAKLCEKSSDAYLKMIQGEKHPGLFRESANTISSLLRNCSEAVIEKNDKAVTANDVNVTTPVPMKADEYEVTENYPDYEDDANSTKAMSEFDQASMYIINMCSSVAEILAATMVVYEDTLETTGDNYTITATKKFGRHMADFNLTVENITLFPSHDFAVQPNLTFDIFMCATQLNPFWYLKHEVVITSVAVVHFVEEKGKIRETFRNPFVMNFQTKPNELKNVTNQVHVAALPQKAAAEILDTKHFYETVSQHSINVMEMQGFVVEFKDLSPEVSFDVLITDFSKPTLSEFKKKAMKINSTNFKIFQPHEHRYDGWHFLSVLPSNSGSNIGSYSFSVVSFSCIMWDTKNKEWQFTCKPMESSTKELIKCECYHTSAYAAGIFYNDLRLEVNQDFKFKMELQSFNIVISVLAVTFLIYCILLTLISLESEQTFLDNVFFLSDVPYEFKFAYLIIVKTGDIKNAGTTSNVTIKLTGEFDESKEHVLNYPDPELRLLQKQEENWFVLGCANYLGEIQHVTIWFDAIGHSPSWYLSQILVYDMQTTSNWTFDVEQWFQLGINDERYCVTFRADENEMRLSEHKKKLTFKKRVYRWIGAKEFGPHMWNIVHCDANLSKIKRLTVMYSVLLSTFTIQLFLYDVPKLNKSDGISYVNNYGIYPHMLWITAAGFACAMIVHFPLVYFFRKYNKKYLDVEDKFDSGRCDDTVTFICWAFVIFHIITCMTLLIVFGLWIPDVIALLWLTTIAVSVIIYVLLFENVFRKIYSLLLKSRKRIDIVAQFGKVLEHVRLQRSFIYKKFGRPSLRRYFTHLYVPLEDPKRKDRRSWILAKERILEMLEDLIMIVIYVALLYLVILADRPSKVAIQAHNEIRSLMEGQHVAAKIDGVKHLPDLIEFVNTSLIPSVHSLNWYGDFAYPYPGIMKDYTNKFLGVMRYRQLRVKKNACRTHKAMKPLNLTCRPEFSASVSDKGEYEEKWQKQEVANVFSRMTPIWTYTYSQKAGTLPKKGVVSLYPGGGYIAKDGRTWKNSIINFKYICEQGWLDVLTRAVFVEVLCYSPYINIFASVTVMFELSATGFCHHQISIQAAKLLFLKKDITVMRSVVFTSFAVIVVILTCKIFYRIAKKIKIFYKDLWLLVDLFIIALNIGVVVFYTNRPIFVKKLVDELSNHNNNEFVNYFRLFDSEVILTVLAATLVFVATLRLCKLLRFLLIFKVVGKTLKDSAPTLLALLCFHGVTLLGFTFMGHCILVEKSPNFKDLSDSFVLLLLLFVGFDKTLRIHYLESPLERLFYSCYMFSAILFNTLYITIIMFNYNRATVYYSNEGSDNVIRYLKELYVFYSEYAKVKFTGLRVRGGGQEQEEFSENAAIAKSDQHRYAEMLTVPSQKMKAMTMIAKCVLRNVSRKPNRLKEQDYELMRQTVMTTIPEGTEDTEKFFICHTTKTITLVDNLRLERMEEVVDQLLLGDSTKKQSGAREIFIKKIMATRNDRWDKINENLNMISGVLNRIHIHIQED